MEIALSKQTGYHLVECHGQLDESAHRPFADEIHPLLVERGAKVVVDLSDSRWVNSEGIAAMVKLVTDASDRGCQVVYAAPNEFVREVLEVTRLEKLFVVASSLEEAKQLLQQGAARPAT